MTLTKIKVLEFLNSRYPEGEAEIELLLDDEIQSWVDSDWEEDGYDSEYDWYVNFGHGEAEDAVRDQIQVNILENFHTTFKDYQQQVGEEVWDTITELYPCLNK